jgi:hypothetical protein
MLAANSGASREIAQDRAHRFAKDQLKAFVERIERLEEGIEKRSIAQFAVMLELARHIWADEHRGPVGRRVKNPMERFLRSVLIDSETGCWNWFRSMNTNGYAGFPYQGRRWLAHRWIYAVAHGPIPRDLVIDHKCHNKCCVNVAHLQAITQSVNVRRSIGRPIDLPKFIPFRAEQISA